MTAYLDETNAGARLADWLAATARWNRTRIAFEPERAALLVVDMQRNFTQPGAPAYLPETALVAGRIGGLAEAFRHAGRPVIWTRHAHRPDGGDAGLMATWWSRLMIEGSRWTELDPDLERRPGEPVIVKNRYSAFHGTELAAELARAGAEQIVVTGVMTDLCVETTAREAFMRDLVVFVPADATATACEELHRAALLGLAHGFAVIAASAALEQACRG